MEFNVLAEEVIRSKVSDLAGAWFLMGRTMSNILKKRRTKECLCWSNIRISQIFLRKNQSRSDGDMGCSMLFRGNEVELHES